MPRCTAEDWAAAEFRVIGRRILRTGGFCIDPEGPVNAPWSELVRWIEDEAKRVRRYDVVRWLNRYPEAAEESARKLMDR